MSFRILEVVLDDGISYMEDIKNAIDKLSETIDESNTEGVEV